MTHLNREMEKELFVFDLDFTLWNAGGTWCDCTIPPYHLKGDKVYDSEGAQIVLYPFVEDILKAIKDANKKIAVASRTSSPKNARKLLELFKLDKYLDVEEIYPSDKTMHFRNILSKTGIQFEKMIFFDDEFRNIHDVSALGVTCIHVDDGIKPPMVQNYL